jgi:DNA-directed RNA polymerase subunit H (RpoH/RPB5)
MNISHDINTQALVGINQQDKTQEIKSPSEYSSEGGVHKNIDKLNEVTISLEGKLNQAIDTASDEIDDILLRHTSPEQKQQLDEIYNTLDKLFSKDILTKKEEESAEVLFEKVHVILESSVDKLTTSESETVDKLLNKMDVLTEQLDKNNSNDPLMVGSEISKVDITSTSSDPIDIKKQGSKKALTVAEINALSATELNKLTVDQLKKLNARQLNRLNASQLNRLDPAQLKQLTPSNVDKLNQSQDQHRASI